MTDIILHHYPASPFSEKIRLVLGYKQLKWKSVVVPSIMPKPDVVALTGGYRKTPFMQIGADIFCDSVVICDQLEQLQPLPTLYPTAVEANARIVAQWADSTLFWAAMAYNLGPKGAAQMFANAPPEMMKAFGEDRGKMSVGMVRLRPADATGAYKLYLARLDAMLERDGYLLSPQPTIADFSAYHALWFTRVCVPVMASIFDATPRVLKWMDAMAAIGHADAEKFSAAEAIAVAANSTPVEIEAAAFQNEHGFAPGTLVSISAESFGAESTEGELIAATANRYTLRRHDERAGTVHVHFPRVGYVLKPAGN
jgi:glutathione S-transferase